MLLLLVRHAVTDHVGVRLSGWRSGVNLSAAGRAQAESLVARLEGVPVEAIYSSPLERAVQTAQPLARARRLRVRTRDDLGEVHYGRIEGRPLRALARSRLWAKLNAWPSDVRFPGGESLRETQARALAAVERIRADHPGETVAVVSHGDWVRLVLAHYCGMHVDLYRRLAIDPASVSALRFYELGVQVLRLNDTGTLADLAPPKEARR